jgi:hypothetical protein
MNTDWLVDSAGLLVTCSDVGQLHTHEELEEPAPV